MSDIEYCVKNMRTKSVIEIFPTKQEAVDVSKRLNHQYQTNEYWALDWAKEPTND